VEHTTTVLYLPKRPDHETKDKIKSVTMRYCKICEKFETELTEQWLNI